MPLLAEAVVQRDAVVDNHSIFHARHLWSRTPRRSPSARTCCSSPNIERIGDHATNVAEMVYYAIPANICRARPRSEDRAERSQSHEPWSYAAGRDDAALAELVTWHFRKRALKSRIQQMAKKRSSWRRSASGHRAAGLDGREPVRH